MTRLTLPTAHIATLLRALTRDRDQLAAAGDDAEAQAVQAVIYAVEPQVAMPGLAQMADLFNRDNRIERDGVPVAQEQA
jgi:hypothetical protein